jgi:glycine/D-amino acid oxidase-like deaminating enzyme/nitrite reductase/ring-hydroxylating ferredoxin subunit
MMDIAGFPGEHTSLWLATTPKTGFPDAISLDVDVAIIGGGITGITSALFLKQAGYKVAVIEAGRIIEGVTGYTTAKITSQHDLIYKYLVSKFGREQAQTYADANEAAKEKIHSLIKEYRIKCDFERKPAYVYTTSVDEVDKFKEEEEAAKSLGLPAGLTKNLDLPFKVEAALYFTNQAQFHPRKYLLDLALKVSGNGSFIFENTRATDVNDKPCEVITDKGRIRAKKIIMATYFPFIDKSIFSARMYQERAYLIGIRIKGRLPEGMYISTEPVHSFRTQQDKKGPLLIVLGETHITGREENTIERYKKLILFARKYFDVESMIYYWSTQDNYTADKVPYIGKYPRKENIYFATGFKGWGMTHGTIAAMIFLDLITGKQNPWGSLYDPNRIKPAAEAKEVISENIETAKHFVKDRFVNIRKADLSELEEGEGRLIKVNNQKVAAYRRQGELYVLSPECTHMGCFVSWNNAEKTWDCPCHGSRFSYDGKVVQGPAVKDLEKKEF